jgi:type I restriction enzyme, R subunit
MKPEQAARHNIDKLLEAARWTIEDYKDLNLGASQGVAVREFPLISGFADYLLFVDRKAVGVIEAKPEGTTLTSTEYQSDKYLFSLPKDLPCCQKPLPFAYESTGAETFFRNLQDPDTKHLKQQLFGDSAGGN